MKLALRVLQAAIGVISVGVESLYAIVLLSRYDSTALFVSETLPFPLLLPLVAGLLVIVQIEVIVHLVAPGESDRARRLPEGVRPLANKLLPDESPSIGLNKRWDLDSDDHPR